MQVIQENRFRRVYKKLHTNELRDVNNAIKIIVDNPFIGEKKIGDLSWLYVYKFKMVGQLMLLGYMITEDNEIILTFVDMGTHENFYRDLKN